MTLEEFKDILRIGSDNEKHEAISKIELELFREEVFEFLFDYLKDDDHKNRFFALYHLIDKFSDSLKSLDEPKINLVYNLLFDEFTPSVDRSIWALSIIGDKAIDKLKKKNK
ncbi:MAG: hypothetical protein MI810_18730, partial [Flavobacteriales bacterium]|nr:hypothetical protein [Flavobacteriales bacterium]